MKLCSFLILTFEIQVLILLEKMYHINKKIILIMQKQCILIHLPISTSIVHIWNFMNMNQKLSF